MATYYSCDEHEKLNIKKPDKIDDCMAQQKLQSLATYSPISDSCVHGTDLQQFSTALYVVIAAKK